MKNFFSFASKELYHKYICVKFHKKKYGSQERKEHMQSRPKNTPKWPPAEGYTLQFF